MAPRMHLRSADYPSYDGSEGEPCSSSNSAVSEGSPQSSSSPDKVYYCKAPHCTKAFLKNHKCNSHFTRAHPEIHQRFPCPEDEKDCPGPRFFGSRHDLWRHTNSLHDDDPVRFQCSHCDYRAKRDDNTRDHMKKKHRWEWDNLNRSYRKPRRLEPSHSVATAPGPRFLAPPNPDRTTGPRTAPTPSRHAVSLGQSMRRGAYGRAAQIADGRTPLTSTHLNLMSAQPQTQMDPVTRELSGGPQRFGGRYYGPFYTGTPQLEMPIEEMQVEPETWTIPLSSPKRAMPEIREELTRRRRLQAAPSPGFFQQDEHAPAAVTENASIPAFVDEATEGLRELVGRAVEIVKMELKNELERKPIEPKEISDEESIADETFESLITGLAKLKQKPIEPKVVSDKEYIFEETFKRVITVLARIQLSRQRVKSGLPSIFDEENATTEITSELSLGPKDELHVLNAEMPDQGDPLELMGTWIAS